MNRTIMFNHALVIAAIALSTSAGCQDEYTNAPFLADARFVAAAPSAGSLRIALAAPRALPNALVDVEALSEGYRLTRQVTLGLNAVALPLLHDIDDLVASPPSERTATTRRWRPAPHALDPLEAEFAMVEEGSSFRYALTQGRRGAAAAPTTVVSGAFAPSAEGGAGALTLELGLAAGLVGGPERGRIAVGYAFAGDALVLELGFEAVSFDGEAPADLDYRYERTAAGDGILDFAAVDESGAPFQVKSRWRADGAGRLDARVTRDGVTILSSECWDAAFLAVFAESGGAAVGDPAACAFPTAAYPEVVAEP